jgi:hypothetical protein
MTLYGIDCSNHQGNMTGFGGVATSFLCHKLTEGTTYTDPYASHNLAFARSRHVPVLGGYHYVRSGNGSGQADHFVARARALFGHELRGFLWQLDCEDDAGWADVKAFKHRWDSLSGGAPILFYTGDWWLRPRGWNVASLGFAGLWAAPNRGYVGKAENVRTSDWVAGYGGYDKLTILQYDARPSIGDTNEYAGSLAALRQLVDEEEQMIETSLGASDTTLSFGDFTLIRWSKEYADPGNAHENGTYPGYVAPVSSYVDGVLLLRITGTKPGDHYQTRLVIHDWDTTHNKSKRIAGIDVLDDGVCTTGDQYVNVPVRRYAHHGQHLYFDVAVFPDGGGTDRAAPVLSGASLRVAQRAT